MKNILLLTADMGFGHRSAANAIAAALRETHPVDGTVQIAAVDQAAGDKALEMIRAIAEETAKAEGDEKTGANILRLDPAEMRDWIEPGTMLE